MEFQDGQAYVFQLPGRGDWHVVRYDVATNTFLTPNAWWHYNWLTREWDRSERTHLDGILACWRIDSEARAREVAEEYNTWRALGGQDE